MDASFRAASDESSSSAMRIARSKPSSSRFTVRSERLSASCTFGKRAANRGMSGVMNWCPKEAGTATLSTPWGSTRPAEAAASASSISAMMREHASK
ncbi:MAG: hypothetical protein A3D95_09450 [Betaproteobacteria bacterium RIFCSPHIGHO2_12_FULL_69_13]|nr:MAG: hypothetical protein A3D95_09450 [Betaproteobacteria bacterium RIFCSPHIGHO2_12_FULL_69_13]